MQTTTETEHKANKALAEAEKGTVKLVLLSKDAIKEGQDKIRVSIVALDMAVHANAVQCLMHAEKHGDTSLMTRLLMEVLDDKTGYRRTDLIRWMRAFSPMELNGKKITLTGMEEDGKTKRPFMVAKADATPFYSSPRFADTRIKPIFQDTLLSKLDTMVKEFEAAWPNTVIVDGVSKAIDEKKPFFNGTNSAQIIDLVSKIKELRGEIKSDDTREAWLAQQKLDEAQRLVEASNANKEALKDTRAA